MKLSKSRSMEHSLKMFCKRATFASWALLTSGQGTPLTLKSFWISQISCSSWSLETSSTLELEVLVTTWALTCGWFANEFWMTFEWFWICNLYQSCYQCSECRVEVASILIFIHICFFMISSWNQSHYREVLRWEIFMEQELRLGLDLGWLALLKKNIWANSEQLLFLQVFLGKINKNIVASDLKSCIKRTHFFFLKRSKEKKISHFQ